MKDLATIAQCKNIDELTFSEVNNELGGDINALGTMTWLKRLSLGGCNITDIQALGTLTNLEYLNLYNNKISSFQLLKTCTSLTKLIVSFEEKEKAVGELQQSLPSLEIESW